MPHLQLVRTYADNSVTLGKFFIDGIFLCDSIEPPSYKRLPEGIYDLICTPSPSMHYDVLYICTPAPKKGYEIHRGNSVTDSKGCPLAGFAVPNGLPSLRFSKQALELLVSLFEQKVFSSLEIKSYA